MIEACVIGPRERTWWAVRVATIMLVVGSNYALGGSSDTLRYDFERGLAGWSCPANAPSAELVPGEPLGRSGKIVKLTLKRATSASFTLAKPVDLSAYEALRFDVFMPNCPGHPHLRVCAVDVDEFWFQTWQPILPAFGRWQTVEVDLRPEAGEFESVRHGRPWGPYVARGIQGISLRVFYDCTVTTTLYVDNISLVPLSSEATGPKPQAILNFETSVDPIGRYKKFEITFELSRTYDNPFDPRQVEVLGNFTSPSGQSSVVPGFFYQDYERQIDRKVERLIPMGSPKWKIRFAPREVGTYTYEVQISDGEVFKTGQRSFTCVPSECPGFVRVGKTDWTYFEFDDGAFFYPIGHNIPATFNVKGAAALGLKAERYEGTYAYDRFLDGMARGRENYARIWLAAWSFGLEWSRKYYPTYRGLGRYNLHNAWRFDYVLDKAERLGVYVQLALTTFGHFRSHKFEGDWPYSPYNKANGGPLLTPPQFWAHGPSLDTYQRMVRYAMARWGYSTHIMGWEVCNEIDLVDRYRISKTETNPEIIEWHKQCVRTIRKFDPNQHLTTTNFANRAMDPELLSLTEISYSSTNHYFSQIVQRMRNEIYPSKAAFKKPAIMTECGYDFKGAKAETTERYLHVCLWASYMIPFAGAGMSWWWDFLDDRDLYSRFKPLANFAEGEERRGRNLKRAQGVIRNPDGKPDADLIADALKNDTSGYFWIYERQILRAESDADFVPSERKAFRLELPGMAPGKYRIEFWDTVKGEPIHELTGEPKDGTLSCPVPAFTSDIAGKVKPIEIKTTPRSSVPKESS